MKEDKGRMAKAVAFQTAAGRAEGAVTNLGDRTMLLAYAGSQSQYLSIYCSWPNSNAKPNASAMIRLIESVKIAK
jgi:hypothetical protein